MYFPPTGIRDGYGRQKIEDQNVGCLTLDIGVRRALFNQLDWVARGIDPGLAFSSIYKR